MLRPGGVIGVWSYGLARVSPEIDTLVDHFYHNLLGEWWPAERQLIDAGPDGLQVPFTERVVPEFRMTEHWTRGEFIGYLGTWSAVARFREATGKDPLYDFVSDLRVVWTDAAARRAVIWPLHLRVAKRPA